MDVNIHVYACRLVTKQLIMYNFELTNKDYIMYNNINIIMVNSKQ